MENLFSAIDAILSDDPYQDLLYVDPNCDGCKHLGDHVKHMADTIQSHLKVIKNYIVTNTIQSESRIAELEQKIKIQSDQIQSQQSQFQSLSEKIEFELSKVVERLEKDRLEIICQFTEKQHALVVQKLLTAYRDEKAVRSKVLESTRTFLNKKQRKHGLNIDKLHYLINIGNIVAHDFTTDQIVIQISGIEDVDFKSAMIDIFQIVKRANFQEKLNEIQSRSQGQEEDT
jgi:hypothetical protein